MGQVTFPPPAGWSPSDRGIALPCALLFGAMFNLTLVVAGLKEFVLDELGGTVADATLFFSVETFAYILFAPLWGLMSDRSGRRKVFIVTGFLASSAIYALYRTVDSVPVLLGLRFVQGAFSVMGWSLVMAVAFDHPRWGRQGRYLGLIGASLIFGVAMGAPIGGYLTRWLGARAPVSAAAVLFALLAVASLALPKAAEIRRGARFREIAAALRAAPRIALPMAFHFVDRLAVGLFVVVFPLYLDGLGASDPAVRGRYLALFLLPFALLQYPAGRMMERTGPLPPLLWGSAGYGLLLTTVGFADRLLLWPIMIGLGVLASVMFPPAILLVSRWSAPESRGSAVGGFNLAGSFGFALGPLLGGWVYANWGFAPAFVLCGAIEIVAAAVGWWVVRRWPAET